jgi:cysteine desulfurase
MLPSLQHAYNASSVHAEGREARAVLDRARENVARCIGARAKEIVFTAGGSESDNLAIAGTARALRPRGNHIVTSAIEHHAVLHTLDALEEDGFEVTRIAVDAEGRVDERAFESALREDTVLASIMYANNETGTIEPVAALARIAREHRVLFHTDAVQAAAYLPTDVQTLGVDLLSIAAHKFYGPKGAGALYVRESTPIAPIIHGGTQESAKRAGTENLAAIVGLAAALELSLNERAEAAARVGALRDGFEAAVLARIPRVRVNGGGAARAPHISNLSFFGVSSEQLLMRLDLDGIAVSAGSACASGVIEPSHVIAALGLPDGWIRGVIRFSLGRGTTQAQLARTVEVLERAVADLRSIGQIPA